MAEIIARFADGRLVVQHNAVMDKQHVSGGVAVRIGFVKTIEKVLSIDTSISGYPGQNVAAPLNEVLISGDTIIPTLRRHDMFGRTTSAWLLSGFKSVGALSGVVLSGTAYGAVLTSGSATSGRLTILANVIGF